MNNVIIGIAGKAGSGKDTVASMINYIINTTPEDCTYANYIKSKHISDSYFNICIGHFADTIKDIIANIYGINRKMLNDHKYKDVYWFSLKDYSWYSEKQIPIGYKKITIENLQNNSLASITDVCDNFCVIKIRTLMQYFGTNIFRNLIGKDVWIYSIIKRAKEIALSNNYSYFIIPDVRFQNEVDAIRTATPQGKILFINRNTKTSDNHESEKFDLDIDFVIENNGTLTDLFNQCKSIIKIIEDETD